jgi:transposase
MAKVESKTDILYIGVDKHLKSWQVALLKPNGKVHNFTTSDKAEGLHNHLKSHYPNHKWKCAHEAGFCGFSGQRSLEAYGIESITVNAADIPTSNKEKVRKTDPNDAKKILGQLLGGSLTPIYVPTVDEESYRDLERHYHSLVKQVVVVKNQIRTYMYKWGKEEAFDKLKIDGGKWTKRHISYLESYVMDNTNQRYVLDSKLSTLFTLSKEKIGVALKLRKEGQKFTIWNELIKMTGIGGVNLGTIIGETFNMARFKKPSHYRSYIGLVPDESSSGERIKKGSMTRRGNKLLKKAYIEAAWVSIRLNERHKAEYGKLIQRMLPNKAIIRIATKIVNQVFHEWKRYDKVLAEKDELTKSQHDAEPLENEELSEIIPLSELTAEAKVASPQSASKAKPFGSLQKKE